MHRTTPILTMTLLLVLAAVHVLPLDRTLLYFSAESVREGQVWRLLTGHLVHTDLNHLAWNSLGLAILGVMVERHSVRGWWMAMITGVVSVNLLLLSPLSQLNNYCGLSGVLNTLLLVLLWLDWRRQPSWQVPLVAFIAVLKTVIEVYSGTALLSDTSWPPYAWSHVAGLLGGSLLIGSYTMLLMWRPVRSFSW